MKSPAHRPSFGMLVALPARVIVICEHSQNPYEAELNVKTTFIPISLLALVLCATGCQSSPETTPAVRTEKFDAVEAKTADATQDMKDYTFAEKADFVTKMQAQLDSIKVDLDQISKQIEQSSDQVQQEDRPKLLALRQQTVDLEMQLQKVKNADESTWDELKAGFKKGYGELKESVTKSRQWMSEKIAP